MTNSGNVRLPHPGKSEIQLFRKEFRLIGVLGAVHDNSLGMGNESIDHTACRLYNILSLNTAR